MTKSKQLELQLTRVKGRRVRVDFKGGEVTSDAGLLLIREVDRRLGLTEQAARQLVDKRQKGKVRHEMLAMIRQRVYGLVAGYEDLNDFDTLRRDPLLQTVTGRTEALASAPTLCRFENGQDRRAAFALNELLVEQFMGSFAEEPEEIILDFDATDNPVHGLQEGRFFHGYYDHYCFVRCMFFAAISFWWPTCGPARSMRASMPGPSSNCWLNGFAKAGPIRGLFGVPTADSAGIGFSRGASATRFIL